MALILRLVSGSSAKRPEPSGINAMPRVQRILTGQPWLFPGYVDFSRFTGPKIPGYLSGDARSGCLQVFDPEALSTAGPALCRTDAGFSRVFSREIGDLLTRDRPNRAPEGAHFGDPASAAQVSRLEKRTVVARAR